MRCLLLVASVAICMSSAYSGRNLKNYLRQNKKVLNLTESFFPYLQNYRLRGTTAPEGNYPWIAKVLHSLTKTVPYLCTAVCIQPNIFISAARCVYRLKVVFTSVIYQQKRLFVKALVLPSRWSKQQFDDIGFIVTKGDFRKWETINTIEQNRTDHVFGWFKELKYEEFEHKVVGYAFPKILLNIPIWLRTVELIELDVAIGLDLCHKILSYNNLINAFPVPCYYPCTFQMFEEGNENCKKYHGVEGGALINKRTNILVGIATWGATYRNYELPVGFAVPNSMHFYDDLECALAIRNHTGPVKEDGYSSLCSDSPESWSRERIRRASVEDSY